MGPAQFMPSRQDSIHLGDLRGDSDTAGHLMVAHAGFVNPVVAYELGTTKFTGPPQIALTHPGYWQQVMEAMQDPVGDTGNLVTREPTGTAGWGISNSNKVYLLGHGGVALWLDEKELGELLGQLNPRVTPHIADGEPSEDVGLPTTEQSEAGEVRDVYIPAASPLPQPRTSVLEDHNRERLFSRLMNSFEEDLLEDGMDHPAEGILAEALNSENQQEVLVWLSHFCRDTERPSFAASVLRCLGRHEQAGSNSWRKDLIRAGMSIDDIEIRDSAVQAAELWEDPGIVDILVAHEEPESWLREYILSVVGDLSG